MLDTTAADSYPMPMGDAEAECREFAAQYPLPNVQTGIALAEAGRVSWLALSEVFRTSLAKGLAAVR